MDFSILVPVYRAEKYLAETVRSALAQEDAFSYEIVLVEDGSPDFSGAVMDELAAVWPEKIRVIHRPHEGTVLTRRAAIREARGDFLVWLDSDDAVSPRLLSRLTQVREEYPEADVILYEMDFVQEDGSRERRAPYRDHLTVLSGDAKGQLYEDLIAGNRLDSLCIKAIRRELMAEDPSDYSGAAAFPYGEDALHCLWPLTKARKVVIIPDILYEYRMHATSVMHEFDAAKLNARYNTAKLGFFEPYLTRWGMADTAHRQRLEASACKAVLDGILYFYEGDYDRKTVLAYAADFAQAHPEMKKLADSPALSRRLRAVLKLFSEGKIPLIAASYRALRTARGLKKGLRRAT